MDKEYEESRIVVDHVVVFRNTEGMSMVRDTILKRMEELGITTYRLSKMVEGQVPQRTVYAFCSGENDATSEVVSVLMEALGLTVIVKPNVKRGRRPRKEK